MQKLPIKEIHVKVKRYYMQDSTLQISEEIIFKSKPSKSQLELN